MAACKWRFSALPAFKYRHVHSARFSKTIIFGSHWSESQQTLDRHGALSALGEGKRPSKKFLYPQSWDDITQ
jgi:hypothetical protein